MTTNRNYDPDDFDWGDEDVDKGVAIDSDPSLEQVYELVVKHIQPVVPQKKIMYIKPSALDQDVPRATYKVGFGLADDQKEWLEKNFLGWNFLYSGNRHHDHPLSHIATELNEIEMVGSDGKGPVPYLDLYGNKNRNDQWGRNAKTLVGFEAVKDYLRHTNGAERLDWDVLMRGGYKDSGLTCITHALYYLSLKKIAQLANRGELRAIVHRHSDTHGFLNNGEIEYNVAKDGMVTQTNVQTGERYTHPTLEPFFHQFSAKVGNLGVTWTVNKLGGDTYMLRFAGCPPSMCGTWVPLSEMMKKDATITITNDVTVHNFLGWTWYTKSNYGHPVELVDVELVNKGRRYIAGMPRTPRNWTNLSNFIRRNCNKNDVISLHGGVCHNVPPEQFADYVNAAFYMDVRHELESAIAHAKENDKITKALNAYYEKGTMPANLSVLTQPIEAFSKGAVAAAGYLTIKPSQPEGPPPPYSDWAPRCTTIVGIPRPKGVILSEDLAKKAASDELWAAAWRAGQVT